MKKILILFILFAQMYYSQSDCSSAITICGNSPISYTPSGHGNDNEHLGGCLFSEHYSVWYRFSVASAGTLTFLINPNVSTDYDFAVYKGSSCPVSEDPIRCSFAGGGNPTGLDMTSTDLSEGASGNGFVRYLDVLPGETYLLIIDNYNSNLNGFSMTWGGTAILASPFNDPNLATHPFIPPGQPSLSPSSPNEILICNAPPITFDFDTLTSGIINGNLNFTVTYHNNPNDALTGNNPISGTYVIDPTIIYYYSIHYQDPLDPDNLINSCREIGTFKFINKISINNTSIYACNNYNSNSAIFDLTTANVSTTPNIVKKYYPTLADLNANTNEIINPTAYISSQTTVFVKITTADGCTDHAKIDLLFYPPIPLNEAKIEKCTIDPNMTTATFDLTSATISTQTNLIKKYYHSYNDAAMGINEIINPSQYLSSNGEVYVRVKNGNGCYAITKIILIVLRPQSSPNLESKIICMNDKTTLNAGSGFDEYLWSTGETTPIINVGPGTYWVKLKIRECQTEKNVKIYAAEYPVIKNIKIDNNTITIYVIGGTLPYQYSLNNINWQSSNVFNNVPRGDVKIYVKDFYNCEPVEVTITVPNLINAITPNGDNINDYIDYSALANKKNLIFTIYNRYGNKLYEADKIRNYKWDGTAFGKKINTDTYWYTISWNENDKNSTQIQYNGWILVKNRE
ncbi:T9SS type B sorting domain-containing protein [Chryseobacterium ginsengisoli]